jgi:hypothetical protein
LYIVEAKVAEISVDIRLTARKKPKVKDLDHITGKIRLFLGKYGYFQI